MSDAASRLAVLPTGGVRSPATKSRGPISSTYRTDISLTRPVKVVVDGGSGNGTAGPIVLSLLKSLGCRVLELYCDMDGRFPHRLQ